MRLRKIVIDDLETIWQLQKEAFAELLFKYRDYETSPAKEKREKLKMKLEQPSTYYYYIVDEEQVVGAIRVIDNKDERRKRIAPLFVVPQYRNRGYAQWAITEVEKIHGGKHWELFTIEQELGNCYLYEKMGYKKTGQKQVVNQKMTMIGYEKD